MRPNQQKIVFNIVTWAGKAKYKQTNNKMKIDPYPQKFAYRVVLHCNVFVNKCKVDHNIVGLETTTDATKNMSHFKVKFFAIFPCRSRCAK